MDDSEPESTVSQFSHHPTSDMGQSSHHQTSDMGQSSHHQTSDMGQSSHHQITDGGQSSHHQTSDVGHWSYRQTFDVGQWSYRQTSDVDESSGHVYDLTKQRYPKKSIALIIANTHFKTFEKREGADVDTSKIYQAFGKLGFETRRHENLKASEMKQLFVEVSQENHQSASMFVCVLMTHGDQHGVYGVDDESVDLKQLIACFKGNRCKSLAFKPKLFFVQACRGVMRDDGVGCDHMDIGIMKRKKMHCTIPTSADFLLAYSTVEGYYAFRHRQRGSYFIQALVEELGKCVGTTEICTVLQRVTHQVAYNFTCMSNNPKFHNKKQCPSFTSTLTKQVFLG